MTHFGLYFTSQHVETARRHRKRDPFRAAWENLEAQAPPHKNLAFAQWAGFRYRFMDDSSAGERGASVLIPLLQSLDNGDVLTLLTAVQCVELLRDHPAAQSQLPVALKLLEQAEVALNLSGTYLDNLWGAAATLALGVALEDMERVEHAAAVYRATVDEDIHPEGYIRPVVEEADGQTFNRQFEAVAALTFTAEAAWHIGLNLWEYNNRGVSLVTAATYLVFYYHFPEKWRWEEGLTADKVQPLFAQHGGFMEMLNKYTPPRQIGTLLDDLRPIYDVYGGGFTTLSHGVVQRRGLFR